eukprot:CAMPEP_0194102674 /NCGR_PEP_ID=MMETSP0150-20130528/3240_1 /TAXON_ID=122233 /ORGANISM="Chaetoceros debilis, Strain MM31A-1" /LENGTH=465 /DNA_ID=CAMNT_0038789693 /DNA_START=51 /DNA_END=1448 /DNA_ORIENTATION=+
MTTATDLSEELAASLSGEHIAKMLRTAGPIVKCVLLRARTSTSTNASTNAEGGKADDDAANADDDSKASPKKGTDADAGGKEKESTKVKGDQADSDEKNDSGNDNDNESRTVLTHLIEEVEIDTTPKKQMVVQTLGGPFTFLGQYEEEGTMVIVRLPEAVSDDDDAENEKDEDNFMNHINPHQLQPPLHQFEVYGDILLMRVAPTEEEEKQDDDKDQDTNDEKMSANAAAADDEVVKPETDNEPSDPAVTSTSAPVDATTNTADAEASVATARILTNEEFFLDYTKEEYIKFASRTDIIPKEEDTTAAEEGEGSGSGDDSKEGSGSEDEDGEYVVFDGSDEDDMEEDEEECQIGMMNLILAQILKRFREENGRGPNTEELLAMRSALAEKLGLDESIINGLGGSSEETSTSEDGTAAAAAQNSERKRKSDGDSANGEKRVKFTGKDEVKIMTDDEAASTTGEEKK